MPTPLSPEQLAKVRALLEGGQAIEAIKYFREVADGSLAEAKAAIEQFRTSVADQPLRPAGHDAGKAGQISALVAAGKKIEAIKLYREMTRCDLYDAKQAIDRLAAEHAGVSAANLPTNAPMKSGCFGLWFAVALPFGALTAWWVVR